MSVSLRLADKALNRLIDTVVKESGASKEIIVKKIGFDVFKQIDLGWPVKTGRSRAAWFPSMRAIGFQIQRLNTLQELEGEAKGDVRINRGVDTFAFTAINAVEYAIFLEMGRSKQAPRGIVRIALQNAKRQLKGQVIPVLRAVNRKARRRT